MPSPRFPTLISREDGAVSSAAYQGESSVSPSPTSCELGAGRRRRNRKDPRRKSRGFRAINYQDRLGRCARPRRRKYPITWATSAGNARRGGGHIAGILNVRREAVELDKFVGPLCFGQHRVARIYELCPRSACRADLERVHRLKASRECA